MDRRRLSLKNPEMSKRVDDGSLAFRRACVDASGCIAPIVRRTKQQTIQFLDVRDPSRPRTETVVGVDVRPKLSIGDGTAFLRT